MVVKRNIKNIAMRRQEAYKLVRRRGVQSDHVNHLLKCLMAAVTY